MDKLDNPFVVSGYYSPEYFCDREKETERMRSAIKSRRNVTLIAHRRIGKTGLIQHVFYSLARQKNYACFYIDIMPTGSLTDLVKLMGKSILGKLDSNPVRLLKQIGNVLSGIKPSLSYDAISGEPGIEFDIQTTRQAEHTFEQIMGYLEKSGKRIIIAFDEFQQIVHYPEKNTEAYLRAQVQSCKNVNFIFSGSHKHLLLSMFSKYGRPFYNSTEIINLEKIEAPRYAAFIEKYLRKGKHKTTVEGIAKILEVCRSHTWFVQYLCNKLYAATTISVNEFAVKAVLLSILRENEVVYYNYRNLLTDFQWQLLKAIAKEETVSQPTSKQFIQKYKLGTPSSVKTALKALTEKEMVYAENGAYLVYDVFLSRWMQQK
ncbi:MAG: AAA family ATPase [Bacteroidia bacterium]